MTSYLYVSAMVLNISICGNFKLGDHSTKLNSNSGENFVKKSLGKAKCISYFLSYSVQNVLKVYTKMINAVKDSRDIVSVLTTKYQFNRKEVISVFNKDATRKGIYIVFVCLNV